MGILTLGLLGVAAIFPVGGYYMQRAEISDRGSQIGQSAMNHLVTSGMLDPRGWRMYTWRPNTGISPNLFPAAQDAANNSYQRNLCKSLANANTYYANQSLDVRQQNLARLFGHAYVIDPMVVATTSIAPSPPANQTNKIPAIFPASAIAGPSGAGGPYSNMWSAWRVWWGSAQTDYTWPIRRVTFPQAGSSGLNMSPQLAENFFRGRDDLTTDLPDRDDRPAVQDWDIASSPSGSPLPLARQWTGDYSWMATVVPTTNAARDAIATNPESYSYDVSVVVFYKRVLSRTVPQTAAEVATFGTVLQESEPYVKASVISTGLNGGELLLQQIGAASTGDAAGPYSQLKAGQWIALCGPHPASTPSEPRFVLKWYQVMSIDVEGKGVTGFNPVTQRVVTLRGPQWPWLPGASLTSSDLSNNLCVCIVRGAVAVHNKTLRLEGRRGLAWSGGGNAGGGSFWSTTDQQSQEDFLR